MGDPLGMGDLAAFIFFFAIICVLLQAVWPYLLAVVVLFIAGLVLLGVIDTNQNRLYAEQQAQRDLIARADQQHQQIMEGDEIGGTYGEYLPPDGLR